MHFLAVDSDGNLVFTKDWTDEFPKYAILSHTWGADEEEVTFQDIETKLGTSKPGYAKLKFCAEQAQKDGLKYFWVDTCCINKANLTELDEAIRSMFRWYKNAEKCYVYLPDVTADDQHSNDIPPPWESAFRNSRWFTRGWTLQELLAPQSVEFFAQGRQRLGTKKDLEQQIHEITGIPVTALSGKPLESFSVEERFRWAKRRETRRLEDEAYCLCGIFGVSLTVKYGEREEAFERLKKKIGVTIRQLDSHIQQAYTPKRLEVERLSGKPLPLECCYINLCILDHIRDADCSSNQDIDANKLSAFSLPARLKVETPPKSRRLSFEALFELRKRKDGTTFRPSRILVWGRAGMGKTTLCKKMVYEFYHNNLWKDLYDRIIWLPLRRLKLMGNELHGIVDLIRKELFPNRHENRLAENIEKMVIRNNRTLFILDGLDEVSHAFDPDSSIGRVLESLLALPSVIITSRPHSTNVFDHEQLDLELETVGFLPKQVDQYLRRVTTQTNMKDQEISEIQSFIQSRPLVQSLVRIPIQLDAIWYIWSDRRFPKDNITMTTLYQAISRRLWEKDVVRLGKCSNGRAITKQQVEGYPNIEVFIKSEIAFLQELAFQGLHNEIIELTPKSSELCK